jgi:DNA-binding NarL/FixJ family response regulator
VILTAFDLDGGVDAALQAGALAFLLKDGSPEHLVAAVRTVAIGDALLAPTITPAGRAIRATADRARRRATCPRRADRPETEVLLLVVRGMSDAEIAETVVFAYESGNVTAGASGPSA